MRFLADMGVAMRIVEWLRAQSYDVKHLREEGLQRMSDRDIFRKASVVLFRLHNTHTPHVIERLKVALAQSKTILETGSIVVIEESRVRTRRLPLRE
jgi:predicted nuclease of predicted toxin-antitoxin system